MSRGANPSSWAARSDENQYVTPVEAEISSAMFG
jgi:hypothetical protein